MKNFRGRLIPESYNELCEMWEDYYNQYGQYPNSLICITNKNLPAWSRVKEICGDKFNSFCENYNINKNNMKKDYEFYCEQIKLLSFELGKTPSVKDIRESKLDIPDYRWLIENCPDKNIKGYNDFISYLGLKPHYEVSKELATQLILEKAKKLNYKLKQEDFKNPKPNEIGNGTINRIWKSFNNMLNDLNLEINQVGRSTLEKPIKELEDDIKKLCQHLFEINDHKIISVDDVKNCEWCQSVGTYNRRFKNEYGMTLGEYISSIGYTPNNIGMGMVYEFGDGEITKSKFEYETSTYLRKNNYSYKRNKLYKDFCVGYSGNKDCDYVLYHNENVWYVEVAGMLDYTKVPKKKDDKIRTKYKNGLNMKIEMLEDNKLKYKIIYPSDFYEKTLDEIFSFLNN